LVADLLDDPGYKSAASGLSTAGIFASIFGTINGAISAYYAVQAQKNELKSRALSLDFQQSMASLNARSAEREAQSILEASHNDIGRYTMRAGQERAAVQASTAGRGVEGNVGSASEQLAGMDLVKEMDVRSLGINAARAAGAARIQGVNYQNEALMAGVSAQNARNTAGSLKPWAAVTTSLLNNTGQVASYWYNRRGY
jgi:hypothetical protein